LRPLAPRARVHGLARGTLRMSLHERGLAIGKTVEEDEDDGIVPD
jgi:hypothetical protein